jgi:hypothetical protein
VEIPDDPSERTAHGRIVSRTESNMSFTMAPLLIHSSAVPDGARSALRAALETSEESRDEHLVSAARILYAEAGIDCADARELVGLGDGRAYDDCGCE